MKCPVDQAELALQTYEADVRIDACPTCGGAFLNRGELERIQASLERDHADELARVPDTVARAYAQARAAGAPERGCPVCRKPLQRQEHGYCSQIHVDVCGDCGGVWLDRGELEALEVFFERARGEARELRHGFLAALLRG